MQNAFAQPQRVIVLGGSSDIARAIVTKLAAARARTVVLAGRNRDLLDAAADEARTAGATNTPIVEFDANNVASAGESVARAFAVADGAVDLVIVAVGLLGDQHAMEDDPTAAASMAEVNFAWPVAALAEVRRRLVAQGHGRILVMSSVAAIRVRRNSYLYAGAKAGLDRLCLGMADSLIGTGVTLHILRPGFVHTKMTAGHDAQPFAVDADRVARDAINGMTAGRRVITTPSILAYLFVVLSHLPPSLWRKVADR